MHHRATENAEKRINELTRKRIGAAIEVHPALGPGLLESAYEECLAHELTLLGLSFERQTPLPLVYKGRRLECGYRIDLLVETSVLLELKSVDPLVPIHDAQLLTYFRLSGIRFGLLLNFDVPILSRGLRRRVNGWSSP